MTASKHGVLDYMFITNTTFWNGLTQDEQRLFRYAMNMALRYGNAVAKGLNDQSELKPMKRVTVLEPTRQQLAVWQSAMKPLWQEYEPVIGADILKAAQQAEEVTAASAN
ncbi:hypothetical protein [Marinobacter caseinilyticus]|uniref:hypothetical protein n=1 Tax=Marinobacter caseinilyticus TaxID=2692195 RepID=UPI00249EC270|nr:hypothetical protein [Marinobacter caseinilyticus]